MISVVPLLLNNNFRMHLYSLVKSRRKTSVSERRFNHWKLIVFIYFFTAIALFNWRCSRQENFVDFNASELTRLICGDSIKSWVRTRDLSDGEDQNESNCSLKLIYRFQSVADSSATFGIYLNPGECSGQDSLQLMGKWSIENEATWADVEDTLIMIEGKDTLHFGIKSITSTELKLVGSSKGKTIENDLQWLSE